MLGGAFCWVFRKKKITKMAKSKQTKPEPDRSDILNKTEHVFLNVAIYEF